MRKIFVLKLRSGDSAWEQKDKAMMTTNVTTTSRKQRVYFTFAFRNCLDLVMSVSKLAQLKYVMLAFNSKQKYENLAAVVHVLRNTPNFVVSRCYCKFGFLEDGKEMHKDL